ncbi:MAG: zinc ribbon domain-containing protein, partial [Anaerolineales bacterium]
ARSLVSLVPLWGILPKISITYAGTYVVGQVVLQWYLTGRHLSRKQIQALYSRSLTRGKELGRNLMQRLPRLRLPRLHLPRLHLPRLHLPRLGLPQLRLPRLPRLRLPRPGLPRLGLPRPRLVRTKRRQLVAPADMLACPQCGRSNAADASYCQYCGEKLSPIEYNQPL